MNKAKVSLKNFSRLLHPYNAFLIATQGKDNKPNIMTASWLMPISSDPPYLGFAIRNTRHSYKLLKENPEFTVNIANFNLVKEVVICGRKSGKDIDKFKETKFTAEKSEKIKSPIIKECVAHLECKISREIEIGDHILVVGEVLSVYADENCFKDFYNLANHKPVLHIGSNYFSSTIDTTVDQKI